MFNCANSNCLFNMAKFVWFFVLLNSLVGGTLLGQPSLQDAYELASTFLGVDASSQLESSLSSLLAEAEAVGSSSFDQLGNTSSEFPYFGIIPKYIGSVLPGQDLPTWESRCWKKNSAQITQMDDGFELHLTVSGSKGGLIPFACADYYAFTTTAALSISAFPTPIPGTKKFKFSNASLTAAEAWDLTTKGVRVHLFRGTIHDVTNSLVKTVGLLTPLIGKCCKAPAASAAEANLDFLRKYRNVNMEPRSAPPLNISDSFIQSGDFLGVIRLDGLDPMLAWAMGSTTGHTCVCMRDEDTGELFVIESTTNGSYWPTNGIQKTLYSTWMKQAEIAGHHVVHAPLTDSARSRFRASDAWAFFRSQENLNYGFGALLVGWIDSAMQNYPCLPPYDAENEDDKYCLTWPLVETLFPYLTKLAGNTVSQIFLEAWNHRVGVKASGPDCEGCLPPADVLQRADQLNISASSLFAIPESDDWTYSQVYNNGTLTMGPALVCNVLVCRMWKAAGLFDGLDDINCGEFTNLDVYALNVLQSKPTLPQQCRDNDPENPHCQLLGRHKMNLNLVGTKIPFSGMAKKCVGSAPGYSFGSC